ncbi:hypothetical protein G3A_02305 [Bacillus sp. 17376]|uniref:Lipopolysaccharide biosynthesis protein n=1 Tax=Mesobacillus boroniphilus JCM 21738 TaxID=1294265 RepID=W4RIH0_9BACI|nr:hypothetical protein [Mesobacillus boroniphilus]ESU34209.1 hypothetical protein G3A_02305 [Bacillus sp. 17376]GAE44091.1 hypothetical protein JCM21738_772 [Mesobacillus boroniphilus JCM 21738]
MTEEKKRFVLYEYLLYFWKHKNYFLLIPILTTLLIAGVVYALKGNDGYTGTAFVYTGSIETPDLTSPKNLEADFEKINPKVDVFVSGKRNVKITLKGKSKAKVENDLKEMVSEYYKRLDEQYDKQLVASVPYVFDLEASYKAKEKVLEHYMDKLEEQISTPSQYNDTKELIIKTEESIAEEKAIVHRMMGTISFFEPPEVLNKETTKADTYLKESIAAGLILGFVLAFAILILLKYIEDARRYYNKD